MRYVGIAGLLMMAATIAVHLGLPQAIAAVVSKVCKCHKCMSFWLALFGLCVAGCPIYIAALLSLFAAYMSYWFSMLLIVLNKLYDTLWQRLNK